MCNQHKTRSVTPTTPPPSYYSSAPTPDPFNRYGFPHRSAAGTPGFTTPTPAGRRDLTERTSLIERPTQEVGLTWPKIIFITLALLTGIVLLRPGSLTNIIRIELPSPSRPETPSKRHDREERERDEWERERRREEKRRLDEEKRKRDEEKRREEDRARLNIFWETPQGDEHCSGYDMRRYKARIWNLPFGYDWVKGCKETPVVIHGMVIPTPDECEDRGLWGGMVGTWMVKANETSCTPVWRGFENKGCISTGLQRIEARLWDIHAGEDWEFMCNNTPADIHGVVFPNPKSCINKGLFGMYGAWDLAAPFCQ